MFPLSFQIVRSFLFAPTRKSSTDDSRFGFENPPFLLRELSKDDGQWLRIAGFLIRFFMLRSPQCSWDTKPIRFILSSEISYNLKKWESTSKPLKLSNFYPLSRKGSNSIRGQRWIYLLPSQRNFFNPFLSNWERPSCLIPLPVFQ
jgi:hypothetical protein